MFIVPALKNNFLKSIYYLLKYMYDFEAKYFSKNSASEVNRTMVHQFKCCFRICLSGSLIHLTPKIAVLKTALKCFD